MVVDEDGLYALTKYSKRKGKIITIESDHKPVFLDLDIKVEAKQTPRTEFFNFRNKENLQKFKFENDNSSSLRDCLSGNKSILKQGKFWFKCLRGKVIFPGFIGISILPTEMLFRKMGSFLTLSFGASGHLD